MSSPVAVCNKALALLGANTILSLDDDQTEAIVCKAAYNAVRDKVLEDRVWTFASGRTTLNPDAIPPDFGYSYRFLIPNHWVRVVNVDSPNNTGANYVGGKFRWAREGQYILCDSSTINVKFLDRVEDVAQWSAAAIDAFSYALASEICVPLTENSAMMERLLGVYMNRIVDAGATDGAQGVAEQLRATRWRAGR